MQAKYSVELEKEAFVFSAAHFITFNGDVCERLHGHNYSVRASVAGPLDDNHYVIDFLAVRDALVALTRELDHYVLLPTRHPLIRVVERSTASGAEVEATFRERRWVFPREDCVLLPVENTTAELLARYLANRLIDELEKQCGWRPAGVRLAVDENFGQWAICELRDE
jgi:6-pyruvoyltetrahydropterin/6-carboxytetrahydropterin synthase